MRFIKTPTPPYQEQDIKPPTSQRPPGVLVWLASLLRTPTPAYKAAPPGHTAHGDQGEGK